MSKCTYSSYFKPQLLEIHKEELSSYKFGQMVVKVKYFSAINSLVRI